MNDKSQINKKNDLVAKKSLHLSLKGWRCEFIMFDNKNNQLLVKCISSRLCVFMLLM